MAAKQPSLQLHLNLYTILKPVKRYLGSNPLKVEHDQISMFSVLNTQIKCISIFSHSSGLSVDISHSGLVVDSYWLNEASVSFPEFGAVSRSRV